jgi:hypothetical protein
MPGRDVEAEGRPGRFAAAAHRRRAVQRHEQPRREFGGREGEHAQPKRVTLRDCPLHLDREFKEVLELRRSPGAVNRRVLAEERLSLVRGPPIPGGLEDRQS